jgi:hypothetical protein
MLQNMSMGAGRGCGDKSAFLPPGFFKENKNGRKKGNAQNTNGKNCQCFSKSENRDLNSLNLVL